MRAVVEPSLVANPDPQESRKDGVLKNSSAVEGTRAHNLKEHDMDM